MAKSNPENRSELVASASALDEQLRRFEAFSENLRKLPLDSQKNLERAAKLLSEVAGLDELLGKQVQGLVSAIATVRDRQSAQAEGVRAKADLLSARAATFQGLLAQFAALGTGAGELNLRLQQAGAKAPEAPPLPVLYDEMGDLAGKAEALARLASQEGFGDISRQADGLRQQILAARGKLRLLEQRRS